MRDAPRPDPGPDGSSEKQKHDRARRTMTYLLLFAITMFFAGLVSAYIVSMSGGYWVRISMPRPFFVSTALILTSSIVLHSALAATRKGEKQVPVLVGLTFVLGVGFAAFQFQGWNELVARGITFSPNKMLEFSGEYGRDYSFIKNGRELVLEQGNYYLPEDLGRARPLNPEIEEQRDRTGPYFYALTLLHLAHLAFGLLALLITLLMAVRARYTAGDHVGLWAGALYWHFLGGLWVFLFLFLILVH